MAYFSSDVTMMKVAIIGGGPAGLMAAETAVAGGVEVELYDAMPSVGRKFLLAGKGGLNLTHSEPIEPFLSRYGTRRIVIEPAIRSFSPETLRAWARGLGVDTFVGTSGRIFPADMKAAPLLRAWLHRLRQAGVQFFVRHRWYGWDDQGRLLFETPQGARVVQVQAVILALGGGSWPSLGSDAAWVRILAARNIPIVPLEPANCGFDVRWTDHFRTRFAGHPVKTVGISIATCEAQTTRQVGEFMVTETGVEGGLIYAVSRAIREQITAQRRGIVHVDLTPDRSLERLRRDLSQSRGKRTIATHLKRRAGLDGVKAGLLYETLSKDVLMDPVQLASAIKSLPLTLVAPRPLEEVISTAGGVSFDALDANLMVRSLPGVFCAGEMLDWEAPTGGYLLTACLATGYRAGQAAVKWLTTCIQEPGPVDVKAT